MKIQFAFLSLAIAGTISSVSSAVLVPVANYNFSDPLVTGNNGYYQTGTPTSWSTVGFPQQYIENATNGGFATGTPSSDSNVQPGISGPNNQYVADDGKGTLYQDLGVAFQPNTTYTVDISGGNRDSDAFGDNNTTFGLISSLTPIPADGSAPTALVGATTGYFDEYKLSNGSFVLATTVSSSIAQDFTFTTGPVAPAGDLVVYTNSDGTGRMHVGEVFVTATPEPASIGLLGLGAIGLLRRRRA